MTKKQLQKIGTHTWVYLFDSIKDRPNLGYIKGENMAVAVDAGHSSSHVEDFYRALEDEMLPLPDLTVITHWHWDHTFGMHAVHGRTAARPETNVHLKQIMEKTGRNRNFEADFLKSDPCIRREYAGGIPLVVVPAQEEIEDGTRIDLGGVRAELLYTQSPHTEDALMVYVPEDRVVFIGDAQLGEFPSWRMDYDKLQSLESLIRSLDVKTVVDGHWNVYSKADFLFQL